MRRIRCALLVLISACACADAQAQDRMPPLSESELTPAQEAVIEELLTVRGISPRGPWIPLLRSPEVLTRARSMGDYLRYESALPPRLSELVILLVAREWTQHYEWFAHRDIAIEAGLSRDTVGAIAAGRYPDEIQEDEAAIYDFCVELMREKDVSDTNYSRVVELFGEQGVIDTVGIVGYYTLLAMVMNTARTPLPGGAESELEPL